MPGFSFFSFSPLTETDLPLLAEWRARPHIAAWLGPADTAQEMRAEYLAARGQPPEVEGYMARHEVRLVGFIQSYVAAGAGGGWWPDERDPGVRGIDQFLAEESDLGRGLGTAMIRAFLLKLFEDCAVRRVQTDPSPTNLRAIRSYEKAGFRAVGKVDTPDGPALLMYCERPAPADDER